MSVGTEDIRKASAGYVPNIDPRTELRMYLRQNMATTIASEIVEEGANLLTDYYTISPSDAWIMSKETAREIALQNLNDAMEVFQEVWHD